jgi:predicted transcriptional regulator YheO
MDKKSQILENYAILARGIAKLFSPLAEVVIHDLSTKKICFISGALSNRKIGDDSLIDFSSSELNQVFFENFTKINFDGRLIKSISIPIKEQRKVKAIMCINCDISVFKDINSLSEILLSTKAEQPKALFALDWREQIHEAIHSYIKSMRWDFAKLTSSQKKAIVHHLFLGQAFLHKNAADHIAKILKMGRATIFNYLKNWRNNPDAL